MKALTRGKITGSILLTAVLAFSMPMTVCAETYDIANGSISVNATTSGQTVTQGSTTKDDNAPVITGSNSYVSAYISISADSGATANVTLSNLTINDTYDLNSPIETSGTGNVVIELDGTNALSASGGLNKAALGKGNTGSLTIKDDTGTDGSLTATGDVSAAGIGGSQNQSVENIIISGGTVTSTGGLGGAGIGGGVGGSGSGIEISGGTVTATGGQQGGSGIGGGSNGNGSNITITDGSVTANGGENGGAGIGGGLSGSGSGIEISGGSVTATGGRHGGSGIGGGGSGNGSNITITDGSVTATGGENGGAGIGGGSSGSGSGIEISGGTVTSTGGQNGGAGIGGGYQGEGSNITISGGTVTSTGGQNGGAGIGGGYQGEGSNITISGGTVTATGSDNGGSGIGGGYSEIGNGIEISGGTVKALGGYSAAGIGSGENGTGSNNIVIKSDAKVSAVGGAGGSDGIYTWEAGAAIGDGGDGNGNVGTDVTPDTTGLYSTGFVSIYPAGTSASSINPLVPGGTTTYGTLPDPNAPITPPTTLATPSNPTTGAETITSSSASSDNSVNDSEPSSIDFVLFLESIDKQIEDNLKRLNELLSTGKTEELQALRTAGIKLDTGDWVSFRKSTYALIEQASKAGIPVTIDFIYQGQRYSTTIPAYAKVSPVSLCNEEGYCGFLNLIKNYGGVER